MRSVPPRLIRLFAACLLSASCRDASGPEYRVLTYPQAAVEQLSPQGSPAPVAPGSEIEIGAWAFADLSAESNDWARVRDVPVTFRVTGGSALLADSIVITDDPGYAGTILTLGFASRAVVFQISAPGVEPREETIAVTAVPTLTIRQDSLVLSLGGESSTSVVVIGFDGERWVASFPTWTSRDPSIAGLFAPGGSGVERASAIGVRGQGAGSTYLVASLERLGDTYVGLVDSIPVHVRPSR